MEDAYVKESIRCSGPEATGTDISTGILGGVVVVDFYFASVFADAAVNTSPESGAS